MSDFWNNILTTSLVQAGFLLILLAVFFVFNVRRMRKRHALLEKFQAALIPGKKVVIAGGLVGKLVKIDNEFADVELNKGNVVTVTRYGIQDILD